LQVLLRSTHGFGFQQENMADPQVCQLPEQPVSFYPVYRAVKQFKAVACCPKPDVLRQGYNVGSRLTRGVQRFDVFDLCFDGGEVTQFFCYRMFVLK